MPELAPGGWGRLGPGAGAADDVDSDLEASEDSVPNDSGGVPACIDTQVLRRAFRHIDDGGGVLGINQFRRLYGCIFDSLEWNDESFEYTESVFNDIDADGSGGVTWQELTEYLNASRYLYHSQRAPSTLQGKIWRVVGYSGSGIRYTGAPWQARVARWYRVAAAVVTLVSFLCVVAWSLPESETRGKVNDPLAHPWLQGVETFCMVWIGMELILYILSYPTVKVRVDAHTGRETVIYGDEDPLLSPSSNSPVRQTTRRFSLLLTDSNFWVNVMVLLPWLVLEIYVGATEEAGGPSRGVAEFLIMLKGVRMVRFLKVAVTEVEINQALLRGYRELLYLVVLFAILCVLAASFVTAFEIHDAFFDHTTGAWVRNANSTYDDAGDELAFQSIPQALWWACVTISTVGYGDRVPVTAGGKTVAVVTMLAGTVVCTYCISTVTSTFSALHDEALDRKRKRDHCNAFYEGLQEWVGRLVEREATLVAPTEVGVRSPTTAVDGAKDRAAVARVRELEAGVANRLAHLAGQLRAVQTLYTEDINALQQRNALLETELAATQAALAAAQAQLRGEGKGGPARTASRTGFATSTFASSRPSEDS